VVAKLTDADAFLIRLDEIERGLAFSIATLTPEAAISAADFLALHGLVVRTKSGRIETSPAGRELAEQIRTRKSERTATEE
jgi:hypothetical protein